MRLWKLQVNTKRRVALLVSRSSPLSARLTTSNASRIAGLLFLVRDERRAPCCSNREPSACALRWVFQGRS